MRRKVVLRAIRPNEGLAVAYKRKLFELIDAMHDDVMSQLLSSYGRRLPALRGKMAMDKSMADDLRDVLVRLRHTWTLNFNNGAKALAKFFAKEASKRTDYQLRVILKDAGFSIGSPNYDTAMIDVLRSIVHENVALIRSIPEQYFTQIEGATMRMVQRGGDMASLSRDLRKHYGVTKKRAWLISSDQNKKANSAIERMRQVELGVYRAVWQHSHAGKTPRPSHVRNDGREYDTRTGWYDPDEGRHIFPGELINCRCTSRPIISRVV